MISLEGNAILIARVTKYTIYQVFTEDTQSFYWPSKPVVTDLYQRPLFVINLL